MKYLFLVFCCGLICSAKGQKKSLNCSLLQASIKTSIFKKRFKICSVGANEEVRLVDKSKSFAECTLKDVCNKHFSVHSDASDGKADAIEIFRVDKKGNIYTLYFHRPTTGSALTLRFTYEKDLAKLLGYDLGAF